MGGRGAKELVHLRVVILLLFLCPSRLLLFVTLSQYCFLSAFFLLTISEAQILLLLFEECFSNLSFRLCFVLKHGCNNSLFSQDLSL